MTSSLAGIVRFLLFIAVIALAASLYYAYGQKTKLETYQRANAALVSERDSLAAKNSELMGAVKDSDVKVQESNAKIADLQAQLEAATKPRGRR